MNTYIVHYKKMTERKEYLNGLFPDAIWIDMFERETFNLEEFKMYKPTIKLWYERIVDIYKNLPEYRKLESSEICNYLSHLKILELMVQANEPYALVLEDDIIPIRNFFNDINEIIKELPENFDFIFLGTAYSIFTLEYCTLNTIPIKVKKGQRIYKKLPPLTRTVDSYIVSLNAAKKLLSTIDNIIHPYDWDLNYFFKLLDMEVYWCEPGITQQGSMIGRYDSSIR